MLFKRFKKTIGLLTAVALGVSITASSVVFAEEADGKLSNIVITPSDRISEGKYWISGGTTKEESGEKFRFADGNDKIVYEFPIDPDAKAKVEAGGGVTVIVVVRNNYTVEGKADEEAWDMKYLAPSGGGSPRVRYAIDISEEVRNGAEKYSVRVGDQTTNDGHGGCLFNIALVYQKMEVPEIGAITEADKGKPVSFKATSLEEKKYLFEGGGQEKDSSRFRFMDNSSTVTYKIPYDSSKDAVLGLVVSANYVVWLSDDNKTWIQVDNNPTGLDEDGKKLEAARESLFGMKRYDLSNSEYGFKGKDIDYVYLKVGCQNVQFGNGACVYGVELRYAGEEQGSLYNSLVFDGGTKLDARGDGLEAPVAMEPVEASSNVWMFAIAGAVALVLAGLAFAQFAAAQRKLK